MKAQRSGILLGRVLIYQAGERPTTISVQELAAPLMAIQSDTEPPVTSDDNLRTPADSPILAPINLRGPLNARLKKGKGRKGKLSPYQSRCVASGDQVLI